MNLERSSSLARELLLRIGELQEVKLFAILELHDRRTIVCAAVADREMFADPGRRRRAHVILRKEEFAMCRLEGDDRPHRFGDIGDNLLADDKAGHILPGHLAALSDRFLAEQHPAGIDVNIGQVQSVDFPPLGGISPAEAMGIELEDIADVEPPVRARDEHNTLLAALLQLVGIRQSIFQQSDMIARVLHIQFRLDEVGRQEVPLEDACGIFRR